jgi:phage terminase large subunit GpA-like protein
MILFFGIRPGKTINIDLKQLKCPHCNQNDTLNGESTPNFFHLFWIPIFRVSTTHAVHCNHCKKIYYKEEFTKEMKAAFER